MITNEGLTTSLSILAIVVSVGTLLWQVWRAKQDEPELSITGSANFGRIGSSEYPDMRDVWFVVMELTNAGGAPATVNRIYWEIDTEGGPMRWSKALHGEDYPFRIEARDSRRTEWEMDARGKLVDGLWARAAADVVLRPTRQERRSGMKATRTIYGPRVRMAIFDFPAPPPE